MQRGIRLVISGIGLVLLQVLILQQIYLGSVADYFVPFVFPMLMLKLPFTFNKQWLMVIALAAGFLVDAFYNTPGLNASASVFIAFIRPVTLSLIAPRDGFDLIKLPSYISMGFNRFIVYVLILMFLYHLWFFSLEVFKITYIHIIFLKAFFSSLLATALILIIEVLTVPKD